MGRKTKSNMCPKVVQRFDVLFIIKNLNEITHIAVFISCPYIPLTLSHSDREMRQTNEIQISDTEKTKRNETKRKQSENREIPLRSLYVCMRSTQKFLF